MSSKHKSQDRLEVQKNFLQVPHLFPTAVHELVWLPIEDDFLNPYIFETPGWKPFKFQS